MQVKEIFRCHADNLRALGFSVGVAEVGSEYGYLPEDEKFGLNDLGCKGGERSLLACPHTQTQNCLRGEVAGVTCLNGEQLKLICS